MLPGVGERRIAGLLGDPRSLALYLGAWLPIGLLLAGAFAWVQPGGWGESLAVVLPLVLVYAFQCLSAWWVARSVPLPETSLGRAFGTALVASGVASLAWLALGYAWTVLLANYPAFGLAHTRYRAAIAFFFVVGALLYALAILAQALFVSYERSRSAERRALELQVLARDAELRSLKAQLDPHFLFNSLNSVSALVGSDPGAARRMCLLLAGFFRKSLGLGTREAISLSEELYLAETYLAIEEVRFGRRLQVAIEVAEDTLTLAVPPLVLQPLVENAVHHGIAQLIDGGTVRVGASRFGNRLALTVQNPWDAETPGPAGTGLGLANVRARVAALFGGEGAVEVERTAETFLVRVLLPLRPATGAT
jgi:two-component system, LytTR family, sensor histidine kinase AlgZ